MASSKSGDVFSSVNAWLKYVRDHETKVARTVLGQADPDQPPGDPKESGVKLVTERIRARRRSSDGTPVNQVGPYLRSSNYAEDEITIVRLPFTNGAWLEEKTAYDFLMLLAEAQKEGLDYLMYEKKHADAYGRTYQDQLDLRKKYGPRAADPHTRVSYHERGLSVDFNMSPIPHRTDLWDAANHRPVSPYHKNRKWTWLVENAAKFGFTRGDGDEAKEHWHWVHTATDVTGNWLKYAINLPNTLRSFDTRVALTAGGRALASGGTAEQLAAAITRVAEAMSAEKSPHVAAIYAQARNAVSNVPTPARASPQTPQVSDDTDVNFFNYTTGVWGVR